MPRLMPNPEHEKHLLRIMTAAGHRGETVEALQGHLDELLKPALEAATKKAHGSGPRAMFGFGRRLAKTIGDIQTRIDGYIRADDIAGGAAGDFDSRSLGCWLALAEKAGVAAVPARKILEIPEPLLELALNPSAVEAAPRPPGLVHKFLNAASGGQLDRAFNRLADVPVAEKRQLHALAIGLLYKAGDEIPGGWMVRHDHMGPSTLKTWACIGWEPWSGDDGVDFTEDDRRVVLGPGWVMIGNDRAVDVMDARTTMAIAQACVDIHTFWARPWMKPARRFNGLDICRPASWPEEMRRGTWPAEWRVFIRGGKAVACSSYYPWAEIPGDAMDQAMTLEAMRLAQKIADAASRQGALPNDVHLEQAQRLSGEARAMLPAGTVNATLDFLETADGLLFLEGAMASGPGGYGAHPCAFAGHRWPEGVKFRLDEGINIAEPATWPREALERFRA